MPDIKMRGHHLLEMYKHVKELEELSNSENGKEKAWQIGMINGMAYGREFGDYMLKTLSMPITNPFGYIEIVEGLDDLCAKCPIKSENCLRESLMKEDKESLGKYGFEVGKSYSARRIFMKFKAEEKIENEKKKE